MTRQLAAWGGAGAPALVGGTRCLRQHGRVRRRLGRHRTGHGHGSVALCRRQRRPMVAGSVADGYVARLTIMIDPAGEETGRS
jgi:hypothetical protein